MSKMNGNSNRSSMNPLTEEFREQNSKHSLGKFEYDLYHDEDNVVQKIIRVKRISNANMKNEKWKIFEDNKVIVIFEGNKLSSSEKEFLRTIDGINFLITLFKKGIHSLTELKLEIDKKLK